MKFLIDKEDWEVLFAIVIACVLAIFVTAVGITIFLLPFAMAIKFIQWLF